MLTHNYHVGNIREYFNVEHFPSITGLKHYTLMRTADKASKEAAVP